MIELTSLIATTSINKGFYFFYFLLCWESTGKRAQVRCHIDHNLKVAQYLYQKHRVLLDCQPVEAPQACSWLNQPRAPSGWASHWSSDKSDNSTTNSRQGTFTFTHSMRETSFLFNTCGQVGTSSMHFLIWMFFMPCERWYTRIHAAPRLGRQFSCLKKK